MRSTVAQEMKITDPTTASSDPHATPRHLPRHDADDVHFPKLNTAMF
jgi:hypothetical protein